MADSTAAAVSEARQLWRLHEKPLDVNEWDRMESYTFYNTETNVALCLSKLVGHCTFAFTCTWNMSHQTERAHDELHSARKEICGIRNRRFVLF